jgi:chemotaxis-related protein WspB
MLFLLFQLGRDRYVLAATQVVEVLPVIHLKRIPKAPPSVAGIFSYHGSPVPLIDLTELVLERPSQTKMSTRIILTNYVDETGKKNLIGFLAERVMETVQKAERDFVASGVSPIDAPYLGAVLIDSNGIIQRIEVGSVLPEGLRKQLFCDLVESV